MRTQNLQLTVKIPTDRSQSPSPFQLEITVQWASGSPRHRWPAIRQIRQWADHTLRLYIPHEASAPPRSMHSAVCIRFVDDPEMAALNSQYRHISRTTNVLSFPAATSEWWHTESEEAALLGDIAISLPKVEQEAEEQGKKRHAHLAHMIAHGCLHLLGWDHQEPIPAQQMETAETHVLQAWGFPAPYGTVTHTLE